MSNKKSEEKASIPEATADSLIKDEKPSSNNKKTNSEATDSELEEFVRGAPPEIKTMIMGMMRTSVGKPFHHPLFEKFTPEHISKFLDYCHEDDNNNFKITSSNRKYYLTYTIIALAFLTFLIIYLLPSNKDLLIDILKILIALVGGVGIGFGWKSWSEKKK